MTKQQIDLPRKFELTGAAELQECLEEVGAAIEEFSKNHGGFEPTDDATLVAAVQLLRICSDRDTQEW